MQNFLKENKIFVSIFTFWLFINIYLLIVSSGREDKFYPFVGNWCGACDSKLTSAYDFSEFFVYIFLPLILFGLNKLFQEEKK